METETSAANVNRHSRNQAGETESRDRSLEATQRAYARLAGFMYLFVLVFDIASLVIVSSISGSGNILDASHRIASWELLYRIGLICGLVGSLSTILLAVGLYVALKPVDANLALTALLFRVVESAIGAVGTVLAFGALHIHLAANHANAFDTRQLGALADLDPGAAAGYVAAIFFCVGSTIFFYLFLKSSYIPRLLAGLGLGASVLYLAAFVWTLILPRYSGIFLGVASIPILLAEVSTALWLLIRGIETRPEAAPPGAGGST